MGAKSRLPKGAAKVPSWWMQCTPHALLDYDPEADRRKREAARMRAMEQQLATSERGVPGLMNMVGADGKPVAFDSILASDPRYYGPESPNWPKNEAGEAYDYNNPKFTLTDDQRKLMLTAGYVPGLLGWTAPPWNTGGFGGGAGGFVDGRTDLAHVEGTEYAKADSHGWEKPAWTKNANLKPTKTGEKIRSKGRYAAGAAATVGVGGRPPVAGDTLLGPPIQQPKKVVTTPSPEPVRGGGGANPNEYTITKETKDTKVGLKFKNMAGVGLAISAMSETSLFAPTGLKVGMKVLSINGQEVQGLPLGEVPGIISKSVGTVTIVAVDPKEEPAQQAQEEEVVVVETVTEEEMAEGVAYEVVEEEEVVEHEEEEVIEEEEVTEEEKVEDEVEEDDPGITSVELIERAMALPEDAQKAGILKAYLIPSEEHQGIIRPGDLLDGVSRVAKKYRLMNMKDRVDACRHVAIICRLVILKVYGEGSDEVKIFEEGLRPAFA